MAQPETVHVESSIGLMVKQAASALNGAMDAVLRPLGLSITQYATLEQLAQRPGLSNSELARATFITRQSMNVLLQGLERDGLVSRPATAPSGRILPTTLTDAGRSRLATASAAVRAVEQRMLAGTSAADRDAARALLRGFVSALG